MSIKSDLLKRFEGENIIQYHIYKYQKFSEILATLGIWATIIILQKIYSEILATLDLPLVAITPNIYTIEYW